MNRDYSMSSSDMALYQQNNDYLHKNITPNNINQQQIFGDPSQQSSPPHSILPSQQSNSQHQPISEYSEPKGENQEVEGEAQREDENQIKRIQDIQMEGRNVEGNEMNSNVNRWVQVGQENIDEWLYVRGKEEGKKVKSEVGVQLRQVLRLLEGRMNSINGYLQTLIKCKEEQLQVLVQFKEETSRKLEENIKIVMKQKMNEINRENLKELKDIKNLSINAIDRLFKIQANIASFNQQLQLTQQALQHQLQQFHQTLQQTQQSFIQIFNQINLSLANIEKQTDTIDPLVKKLDGLDQKIQSLQAVERKMDVLMRDRVGDRLQRMQSKLQRLQQLDTIVLLLNELKERR